MRGMWRLQRANRRALALAGGCHRRVRTGVALTFDDGPDPVHTQRLLDVLAAHGAVATFFFVGSKAEAHPELVRRAVANGHAVGSHTRSHPVPTEVTTREMRDEINAGRDLVAEAAGRRSDLFRPCQGKVDWKIATALRTTGVESWLWSVDPTDWKPGISVEQIVDGVRDVRDGDVVLLHDGIELPLDDRARDRSATIDALPAVIELVRAKGLALTTLDGAR